MAEGGLERRRSDRNGENGRAREGEWEENGDSELGMEAESGKCEDRKGLSENCSGPDLRNGETSMLTCHA